MSQGVAILGVVTGLSRCCDAPDGSVLAYAGPDTPGEHAAWLIGCGADPAQLTLLARSPLLARPVARGP